MGECMSEALELLNERTKEIEFYFQQLQLFDQGLIGFSRSDSNKLLKILKSNYLLMVYNLEEACITTAFSELYDAIEKENKPSSYFIKQIYKKWLLEQANLYENRLTKQSVVKKLEKLVEEIKKGTPLKLKNKPVGLGGNMDARKIQQLCLDHGIVLNSKGVPADSLFFIKEKRKILTHGEESFGNCVRDLTLSELHNHSQKVIDFVKVVLLTINDFITQRSYRF